MSKKYMAGFSLGWVNALSAASGRARQIGFSVADQAFTVGGMFVLNIALARILSREDYGVFALTYTIFTFLAGMHNAAIVEAYTVFGSGRHHEEFGSYSSLMWQRNALGVVGLMGLLFLAWSFLKLVAPAFASPTLLGLTLACGAMLTASFARRTFYIRRRPDLAAGFSMTCFALCVAGLWFSVHMNALTGLVAFAIVALAWLIAGVFFMREMPRWSVSKRFLESAPDYWHEHWKYSRWVFVTALVFQLTTQGYYWIAAGLLSVKEVADLRALYNLATPIDQVFVAIALLTLPMFSHRHALLGLPGVVSLWKRFCAGWLAVTIVFAAVALALGRAAMHVVYAGKFDDIAELVGLMALLPLIMGAGHTINVALKSAEKPRAVFHAYVVSALATFFVGVPLVMQLGLRGAVYGMLISGFAYTASLGVQWYLVLTPRAESIGALSVDPK
jgi:O-antigen/teichoic acid export membrane protein